MFRFHSKKLVSRAARQQDEAEWGRVDCDNETLGRIFDARAYEALGACSLIAAHLRRIGKHSFLLSSLSAESPLRTLINDAESSGLVSITPVKKGWKQIDSRVRLTLYGAWLPVQAFERHGPLMKMSNIGPRLRARRETF